MSSPGPSDVVGVAMGGARIERSGHAPLRVAIDGPVVLPWDRGFRV